MQPIGKLKLQIKKFIKTAVIIFIHEANVDCFFLQKKLKRFLQVEYTAYNRLASILYNGDLSLYKEDQLTILYLADRTSLINIKHPIINLTVKNAAAKILKEILNTTNDCMIHFWKKEFDHRHNIINLLKSFVNHWSQFNSSQSKTMPQQSEQFKRLVKESFLVIVVSTQNYEVYLKEPYLFANLYWSNMKGGTTLTRYYVGFTRFCIAPLTLLSFIYIIILISLIYFFLNPFHYQTSILNNSGIKI